MANKKISELPYIDGGKISGNTLVPLVTYFSATTGDTVHTYITDLQNYLTSGITISGDFLPLTGGTVSGTTVFSDSSGTIQSIDSNSRLLYDSTGSGSIDWDGRTLFDASASSSVDYGNHQLNDSTTAISADWENRSLYDDLGASALEWTSTKRKLLDVTSAGAVNWNDRLLTKSDGATVSFDWENGILTGQTNIESSIISATTYLNLPPATFSGGTVTGPTIFTNGLSATTISATTYLNLPGGLSGDYLPLSGGTVTGQTFFTSGVSISGSVETSGSQVYHKTDIFVVENQTINGPLIEANNSGVNIWSTNTNLSIDAENRILYDSLNINSIDWENRVMYDSFGTEVFDWENGILTGQTNIESSTISATTYLNLPGGLSGEYLPLSGGTVTGGTVFTSGVTANTLNVNGLTQTSGITSTSGIIFKQVTINGSYTATTSDYMIDVTGGTFTVSLPTAVGQQGRLYVIKNNGGGAVTVDPFGSETIDGKSFIILGETNSIQIASNGTEWVAMSYNISTVNSSTGVFEFSGLTIASPTTFTVAPIRGWIVDDTTNPLSPQLYYVTYSGGTHTATYVTATTATWIYLTSGGTIAQSNIPITDQQRRQNIALGKLGHANKTSIINAFSQPDFVLSPLAQLRDMFEPINLINGGIKTSANGANLSFNTSAGYLHGLGINFANDTLNPNSLYVTGTAPCTFQYRTQTGGTASNTTFIDPTKKDVGGVVTTLSGTKATNQRIYLVQNGVFRVQYGQVEYSNLTQAIAGIATEQFVEFTNFTTNGILIGVLSVLSTATDLTDTTKAQFFNVSKFGDSTGAAGGSPTTNLQQAYNNSIEPEITTNSTLGALSVKNGAGTADNVTNVFEGANTAGSTTSYVRADGAIYGSTISGVTISATTYQNLPTDIRITGSTYSNNTFTYTNNTGGTFNVLFNTVTGLTVNGNLTVTGNTNVRAFTGTSGTISGTGQSILTVIGSGNSTTSPLFTVQGSSGELFSVNDSLVGSLFSVNDISGLPIMEVFSDNTTLWGSYQAPSLNTTTRTSLTAGTNTIYSIPTSAYTGAFYEYTLISTGTTGARAGQIMSIWSGTSANFTETTTTDIGTTTGVTFTVAVSGSNAVLSSSATTAGWTVKTIIRSI